MATMNLIMDEDIFPKRTLFVVPPAEIDRNIFAQHADIAEQMFISEGGVRMYRLRELTITAPQRPLRESFFYSTFLVSNTLTEEEIRRFPARNILDLLRRIPGVEVTEDPPAARFTGTDPRYPPIFMVDEIVWDLEDIVSGVPPTFIQQIDALRSGFGIRDAIGGAFSIFTYQGEDMTNALLPPLFHIRNIMPLGFQQPVEFYAPRYDTPQRRNALTPDLRTTIHWQPVVQTDNAGVASFEFYTADDPTSYTVIIEGLTDEGSIISKEGRIWRRN